MITHPLKKILTVLCVGLSCALAACKPAAAPEADPLVVYVAAGLKVPLEKIRADYENAYKTRIQLQYGGSNTLLANITVARSGDLFIPADTSYLDLAREKSLLAESIPLAQMVPVLAVKRGNPKNITSLQDLLSRDIRLAQANPDAAAIGKITRDALQKIDRWNALKEKTTVFKPTVTDIAGDVTVGAVDAAIVWDVTVRQFPDLEAITLPELQSTHANIALAVLADSRQPAAALKFARFIAAQDKGLRHFAAAGFTVENGDDWAEKPELRLLSGAMLRPAIEETIKRFEHREGVQVQRIYNGCGILVGQIKAGDTPDAYFACETSFMTQVHDLFQQPLDISTNQIVIAVPKGNPKKISTLADLASPGLRVGLAHEKQSALGSLTHHILQDLQLTSAIRPNVAVETASGDLLINQLLTGSLDAAVVYISNTAASSAKLDALPVSTPRSTPTQPIAIAKTSRQKQLAARLISAIQTNQSRDAFIQLGFGWKVGQAASTQR